MKLLGSLWSVLSSLVAIVVNVSLMLVVLIGLAGIVVAPYAQADPLPAVDSPGSLLLVGASVVAAILGLTIANKVFGSSEDA